MATLYLIEAHARREYACAGCYGAIARGELYFRHDPHPRARMHRAEKIKHICVECMPVPPGSSFERDPYTKRIRWPAEYVLVPEESKSDSPSRLRISTVGIGSLLAAKLATDESFVFRLTPGEFE